LDGTIQAFESIVIVPHGLAGKCASMYLLPTISNLREDFVVRNAE
jgi:hypothetical protein